MDLRAPAAAAQIRPRPVSPLQKPPAPAGSKPATRGWTAVVASTPQRAASPVDSAWRVAQQQQRGAEALGESVGRPAMSSANDANRLQVQLAQLTLAQSQVSDLGDAGMGGGEEEVPESWENDV